MAGKQKKKTGTGIQFDSWEYVRDSDKARGLIENMIKMGSPVINRGNVMSWLVYDELGIRAQQMTVKNLRAELDETNFYMVMREVPELDKETKKPRYRLTEEPGRIPGVVIDTAFGLRDKGLHKVKGVLSHPIINKAGEYVMLNGLHWKDGAIKGVTVKKPVLHLDDGYDPVSEYFFAIPGRVTATLSGIWDLVPPAEDVTEAVRFINYFLEDFEFATKSAKASAVAFMLTVLCREIIDDYVPMLEVRAPQSHSGKSLLVKMMLWAITGQAPAVFTPNFKNTEEFEKELFSLLLNGQNYIFMDNVKTTVQSGFLEMALKSGYAKKRILGMNEVATVYSGMPFVMTANNPTLSEDMKNRIYLLDIVKPPDNKAFLHAKPEKDALEMGPLLLGALFILYNNWDKNYKRERFKGKRMEGFIEWSEVIGGMLAAAGIEGFLDDTLLQIKEIEPRLEQAAGMARPWFKKHGSGWLFVKDTFDFALEAGYVDAGDSFQKKVQKIAARLNNLRRTPLPGGYYFERNADQSRGMSEWRVVQNAGSNG